MGKIVNPGPPLRRFLRRSGAPSLSIFVGECGILRYLRYRPEAAVLCCGRQRPKRRCWESREAAAGRHRPEAAVLGKPGGGNCE